jgi:hypothetical protein
MATGIRHPKARPGDIARGREGALKCCPDCGLPGPAHSGFGECVVALRDLLGTLELRLAGMRSRQHRATLAEHLTGSAPAIRIAGGADGGPRSCEARETFRDRERIKRKQMRWLRRLASMPVCEREAIKSVILEACPAGPGDDSHPPAGL